MNHYFQRMNARNDWCLCDVQAGDQPWAGWVGLKLPGTNQSACQTCDDRDGVEASIPTGTMMTSAHYH